MARKSFVALQRSIMLGEPAAQAMILSGQSGAGKTFSFNNLLSFLAAQSTMLNQGGRGEMTNLISRTTASNPILEAFGNAR